MNIFEGDWSDTHLIADKTHAPWFVACDDRPGIYRLIGLDRDGQLVPASISRVCGNDDAGTLYIGAAKSLTGRIGRLVLQHLPPFKGGNHHTMPDSLAKLYPAARLAVCWRFVDAPENIFDAEHKLMSAYREQFGESPPLNSQG